MNHEERCRLNASLSKIEKLAEGSFWKRLWYDPVRYINAIAFWRLIYPIRKKGYLSTGTKTFFGAKMDILLPAATEIFLFRTKTHPSELRLTRFLINYLRPGDTFCDVGAHFGFYSLLAAYLNKPSGFVFAFEASTQTYEILKRNTAKNPNIITIHATACECTRKVTFHEFPPLYSEFNSMILPNKKKPKWLKHNPPRLIEVNGLRLDDFFEKDTFARTIPPPAIVKIDVEGAEWQVLQGMERLLTRNEAPLIVMEYLPNHENDNYQLALDWVQKKGYRIFQITRDGSLQIVPEPAHLYLKKQKESDNLVLKKDGTSQLGSSTLLLD